jgi:hypothetical protein
MENTIDLRKTGAENIIGKFSKKHSFNILYLYVRTVRSSNIYMTRQAETILMLSDFLKNAQVVILSIVRIENQRLMSCENTVFELAMLVRTMAKGVAGVPSMISIRMSIATAMYVMSIMADTSIKSPLD